MDSRLFFVYMHKNKINGKVYIGMTSLLPTTRFGNNGKQYSRNVPFTEDILKYGWDDGFYHEILYSGLTEKEACETEQRPIQEYDSTNPEFGYNQSVGCEKAHYGYKLNLSDDERNRRRENVQKDSVWKLNKQKKIGFNNPMYGKYYGLHHAAKPVMCIETGEVFSCAKEAGDKVGVGNSHITAVYRGHRKTSAGFHWKYV